MVLLELFVLFATEMAGDDHKDLDATLWLVGITYSATSWWLSLLVTLKCERDMPRLFNPGCVCGLQKR